MRSNQIVAAIFALIFFSSCSIDNLEPNHKVVGSSDIITVLGRVSNFTEQDVVTRSPKDSEERKVTSIAMAIFPVKNDGTGVNGNCVYYEYFPNSNEVMFAINRGDNTFNNGRYVIYAFANMPGMNIDGFGKGTSLEAMLSKAYNLSETTVDIPTDGFPMIGSLGDTFSANTERDNKILYIKPDGDSDPNITPKPGENSDPIIREPIKDESDNTTWDGGRIENTLTIPMKAMYAKINFIIKIDPTEKDETGINLPPQFTFEGYTINNIPASVDFDMATNSDIEVIEGPITGAGVEGEFSLVDKDDELTFSFYLPERLMIPDTDPNFSYPFTQGDYDEIVDKDQNGYRDEDEITRQRYKGLLLGSNQKATNVVISGKYRDHQNLSYDVDYTIHLGEDNYSDFNIIRNKEYNNYVTIKGVENSNDNQDNYISFDHRVNITRSQPAIISLRREMLLDSHFEIRPLRVRKSNVGNVGDINAVKVEVLNPTTTNWMRIERSGGVGTANANMTNKNGESIYINEDNAGPSKGKRRYFTYNLVNGLATDGETTDISNGSLVNSTSVVVPLNEEDQCVWIYVDECIETGDGVRSGVVQVTYGNLTNGTFNETDQKEVFPDVKYTINQRKLFPVTYTEGSGNTKVTRPYYIEYEEEYLHNFDSEEGFGLTKYEGMPWGLPNLQLSYEHKAILLHDSGLESLTDNIRNAVLGYSPFYDFYLRRDFNRSTYYFKNDNEYESLVHDHNGFEFCNEIIADVNSNTHDDSTPLDDINVLTLAQEPKSAIEYCYNKNKRKADGSVVLNGDTGWYLPAIDEAEEIMMSQYTSDGTSHYSYARFEDFQNKYYWSSQPAFYQNIFLFDRTYITPGDRMGHYMTDNPNYARATKVHFKGGDPSVSTNYELVSSGMIENTYYQYLYFTAGGSFWEAYPDVKDRHSHIVEDLIKNNSTTNTGGSFGSDSNGKYFQFQWGNNNINPQRTEKVYAPKFQDGYKHRTKDMARVRCVRKMN